MLNRFFGQKPQEDPKKQKPEPASEQQAEQPVPEQRFSFLNRTRQIFGRLGNAVQETDTITDSLWDELEESLLGADVGPSTTLWLIERLRQRVSDENLQTGSQVQYALREELSTLLGKSSSLRFSKQSPLTVILVIGVNGSGKTTTIAKMAYRLSQEGHQVMLAAGDTFRAAAIDQLQEWGNRIQVPVISQKPNSDPGAVVFDALQAAQSRGSDVLIVDTAGRLHTKFNLMEELKKINKIIQKFVPDGPHELLMVIDATTGQNALLQARKFAEDIGLTGVVITKLDSTAKGGFAFAVADDLGVPIKFIGTGEKVENLMPFEPQNFVAALFA
ncbi:signal recognition particle-docking protein FtsY [Dictyobacter arantiisoli]|uniref:Signal recognition particle receptor FtsY n=1 Tax=Dictyobacter arantiisoli TaxID=2014874 RepID=A0A5A5TFW7_9CHLR|nr:signal recognition particle-docking protein FtsY [Dictyobacter arantiisoli]GCF10115.1 signal recognition particle-docking protein FtsY [Dictyobacter arantiisoli]